MKKYIITLVLITFGMMTFAQCPHHGNCATHSCAHSGEKLNIPVYIVDGVEVLSISDIDKEDIESVNVIKNDTLCNLFAPRVGGIIQITTKSKKHLKQAVEAYQTEQKKIREASNGVRIR